FLTRRAANGDPRTEWFGENDLVTSVNANSALRWENLLWQHRFRTSTEISAVPSFRLFISAYAGVFRNRSFNLLLGDPEASDDELWAALRAVQLEEHIRKIGGLDSWIGERKNTLSAGQSRRLCLARIVLCPARLWLLDEPTAGLDEDTADALMRDLEGLSQGHSVIVVTHNVLPEAFARQTYRLVGGVLVRWLL